MSQFLTNAHYQRKSRSSDDDLFHGDICESLQLHGVAINALCHTLRQRIYFITHTYKQVRASRRYGNGNKEMLAFDYRESQQPDEAAKLTDYRVRLRSLEITLASLRLQYQMAFMANRKMDSKRIIQTHTFQMRHIFSRFAFNGDVEKAKEVTRIHDSLVGMQFLLDRMPFGAIAPNDLGISNQTMAEVMQQAMQNIEAIKSGSANPEFMSLFPTKNKV